MKQCFQLIVVLFLFWAPAQLMGQVTFTFPTVHSPQACANTCDISITITLDSVKLTNIYFDDGTNGSFAFEAFFSYNNVFSNSTLPTGSFFTYDLTVYSDNPNLNGPALTNNLGSVPLETAAAGGFSSLNNPTYNTSASSLGLVLGGAYNSPALLNTLGYDSAVLRINLPCLDTTISANDLSPLPVLWSKLQAAQHQNEVRLNWQTFMEQNNAGFSIERSTNGVSWMQTGFVPSQAPDGNSSRVLSYHFTETVVEEGRYYYRLVQRDLDGQQRMTNMANIRITAAQPRDVLAVYPNPATTIIRLIGVEPNAPFVVHDTQGRLLLRGNYRQSIDVSRLSSGVYWIKSGEKVARFVVK